MSDERGARSMRDAAQLPATAFCHSSLDTRHSVRRAGAAFTLIEMLVVIAIIAILTTLLAPSLQGLFGVAGRRGGANALSAALEQARLAAVENGTSAYVGFASASTNQDAAYSSLIVFRARRDDETNAAFVPLSRWLRLPTGVHLEPASIAVSATNNIQNISGLSGVLPRLGNETLAAVPAIEFDRFGRLRNQNITPVLKVGEGVAAGGNVQFRSGTNALYAVSVLPLTGRVQISETNAPQPQ